MNHDTTFDRADGPRRAASKTTRVFDHCMFGLAGVLFVTVATAASILITLPEALEAVATPAFGAPWLTVAAPTTPAQLDNTRPAANSRCDLASGGQHGYR